MAGGARLWEAARGPGSAAIPARDRPGRAGAERSGAGEPQSLPLYKLRRRKEQAPAAALAPAPGQPTSCQRTKVWEREGLVCFPKRKGRGGKKRGNRLSGFLSSALSFLPVCPRGNKKNKNPSLPHFFSFFKRKPRGSAKNRIFLFLMKIEETLEEKGVVASSRDLLVRVTESKRVEKSKTFRYIKYTEF